MTPVLAEVYGRITDPNAGEALDRLMEELSRCHTTVRRMLYQLDRNGDGLLNREEVTAGFATLGLKMPADQIRRVMTAFDRDMNGVLDQRELIALIAKRCVWIDRHGRLVSWRLSRAGASIRA